MKVKRTMDPRVTLFLGKVSSARKNLGMTQLELAIRCNTSSATIWHLEHIKHEPSLGLALQIADTLDLSIFTK